MRLGSGHRPTVARVILVAVAVAGLAAASALALSRTDDTVVSIGFVPYWDQPRALDDVERHGQQLTVVAPWWYAPVRDGRVVEQHEGYTDTDPALVRRLQEEGHAVMPAVANHRGGAWDFEVVGQILASPDARDRHVEALTRLVVDEGYDGLQLDYENLAAEDAAAYADLVGRVAASFEAHDKTLAVALHAKTEPEGSGWAVGHDYPALGAVAHELHLMAYDYHWESSSPGPPAPLWWVHDVLRYATSAVPPEKLVLGIGLYGYDWGDGERADGLTLEEAEARVRRYHGERSFDGRSQSPVFRYEVDGQARELWFEDEVSVRLKLDLIEEYDLAGAFFWRMGGTTPAVWEAVADRLDLGAP